MNAPLPRAAAAVAAIALLPALAFAQAQSGIHRAFMDPECSPCKDFYRYANGAWLDRTEIPPAYNVVGAGREMVDRNQAVLHRVLERTAANVASEKDPAIRKVGHLYAVLMDSARADREGVRALSEELAFIDAMKTPQDVQRALERYALHGGGWFTGATAPIRLQPEADPRNSRMTIAQLWQGGLGLPDRDFYFRTDPRSVEQRRVYVEAIGRMLALAGAPEEQAKAQADAVMALETALAESSLTRLQMRDPHLLYNKITVKELGRLAPNIDWPAFFTHVGLPALARPTAEVDASMPGFLRQFSAQMAAVPMDTWRAYFRWTVLRRAAGWLGKDAEAIQFALMKTFTGQQEMLPRWKRATQAVDAYLGEALGKAYVASEFPPSSKKRMLEMVANLKRAMAERIASRPWMSAETKKQAKRKLDAIVEKIGYPDKWRDYGKLEIDPSKSAVANLIAAQKHDARWQLDMIGRAPDRTLWGMSPPTVNAYYNPSFNEIVFPAGILQPPQFDPNADEAVNYGGIGMVIGHEITHGFDDEGRKYDADGNLRDWWTAEDGRRFEALAGKVVEQYDGYLGVDTLRVNGRLTLGENIADLGGLTIAYHAWKLSLKGRPAPVIDGWTGEQRFFLGYAQAWRRKYRPESVRQQLLTDPHSPAEWRVNGPVSNMPEFRAAFGCKEGDALVRAGEQQIVIW
uniref:M13 family peptidase n=1 Tax=Eiseniibacteriota bacterium TaxID=2212470 RepID=A0A832I4U1_UNCEI